MGIIIQYFLIFVAGTIVGGLVSSVVLRIRKDGVLQILHMDDDGPYLFVELSKPVNTLFAKRHAIFTIGMQKHISRK